MSVPLHALPEDLIFDPTPSVIRWPGVARGCRSRHDSCRPPVAWSRNASDPVETSLSGRAPAVLPRFIFPCRVDTVGWGGRCRAPSRVRTCDARAMLGQIARVAAGGGRRA